ncbi:MAG: riboflavin synthase [Methylophilaceae bacterium]|jgi:riboflavin synthase|tara:strand:+ start:967 stop:1563 length:597 start_codon:yes stop_codon:yes gene_type:complete
MFTGIIQAVGEITPLQTSSGDIKIDINAEQLDLSDVKIGDSIAINGVCLTVTNLSETHFKADVSKETLNVTTGLDQKGQVNLEKALRLDDRLGGHLVSGHVDGIGQVVQFDPVNDCWLLAIQLPHAISKYIARKGSICVNGVSLTVNTIEKDVFTINIIPHTLEKTILGTLQVGSQVNLEIDQIARYVDRMQQWETES